MIQRYSMTSSLLRGVIRVPLELEAGEGLVVACGEGTRLSVIRIQPEGRRVIRARDAVNGRQLRPGDRLEKLER